MTNHDFKAALSRLPKPPLGTGQWPAVFTAEQLAAIRFALRLADRLMQEPSEGMIEAGYKEVFIHDEYGENLYLENTEEVFKAMRDQLIKEIEEA